MTPQALHELQQTFFKKGFTKEIAYRVDALKKFKKVIIANEKLIYEALAADLGKSTYEAFLTEYNVIITELDTFIKKTKGWSKPRFVLPSVLNFPSRDRQYPEPYGNVLIISPWNYPFQLALAPLIGAVAAGNTVVLKPSEFSSATSQLLERLIAETFDPAHVSAQLGDADVSKKLTQLAWDYIFFTGSPQVGKLIYQAAAQHMTPVTLELGGKNPCVVDNTANIAIAARRIVWGKFLNTGQTCIAPDYLLVHVDVYDALVTALKKEITKQYGSDAQQSPDLGRIIRAAHFDKLVEMLDDAAVLHGGDHNRDTLYIEPTLVDAPQRDSAVMQGEIFGPILPIITYEHKTDIENWVDSYDKPLSAYVFTQDEQFRSWFINRFPYGGGVVNDCIVHFLNDRLPFGGVGSSGIGSYHGRNTFKTFSHYKSVVRRSNWPDIPVKYAPYRGKMKWVKKLFKWI